MRSLRQRAILGGLVWAAIIVAIGAAALFYFFDALTQRRFDTALLDRYVQVVAALGNSGGDAELMDSYLTDPAYQRPYSGRYWQVDGAFDATLASRSLFDSLLTAMPDEGTEPQFWTGAGPEGPVRGISRTVTLDDGTAWMVTVAESLAGLEAERKEIRQSLLITFALIGALGVVGAVIQTSAVLRPLNKLRGDVAHRWDGGGAIDPADYPEEVSPLVADINTLLQRNRQIVDRGRRQAADLAHALKTPSAILRNELEDLAARSVDISEARNALDRVDAQLMRSLARIRAQNSGASAHLLTDLEKSVARMVRLFRSLPGADRKTITTYMASGLLVPMDAQDLEEILGNLVDNAAKWAARVVRISAGATENETWIAVSDDGPGIPEADRREALRSGGRLDTSAPGTGLGLAIAADLVQAYGGTITLGQADGLGGLDVRVTIPARHGLGTASGSDL